MRKEKNRLLSILLSSVVISALVLTTIMPDFGFTFADDGGGGDPPATASPSPAPDEPEPSTSPEPEPEPESAQEPAPETGTGEGPGEGLEENPSDDPVGDLGELSEDEEGEELEESEELEPMADELQPLSFVGGVLTLDGVTAGTFQARVDAEIGGASYASVHTLIFSGTFNNADREFLRNSLTALTTVDFSGYTGSYPTQLFMGLSLLARVKLAADVPVSDQMFENCTSLARLWVGSSSDPGRDVIDFTGYTASTYGADVFVGCTSINTVILLPNVQIAPYMFQGCTNLKKLWIAGSPEPAEEIVDLTGYTYTASAYGAYSFQGCRAITTLRLAPTVALGSDMFRNATALTTVIFQGAAVPGTWGPPASGPFANISPLPVAYVPESWASASYAEGTPFRGNFSAVHRIEMPSATIAPAVRQGDVSTTVNFPVTVGGAPVPYLHQWQMRPKGTYANDDAGWTDLGASTSTPATGLDVIISNANMDGNQYRYVVTSLMGTSASNIATLMVSFAATLNVRLDGQNWVGHNLAPHNKSIGLQLTTGGTIYFGSVNATTGVVTIPNLANGTYRVVERVIDTDRTYNQITLTINNGSGNATLNYYTVSFAATNSLQATGSSVAAAYTLTTAGYSSTNITPSGSIVIGGGSFTFTATGTGATAPVDTPRYTYLWSGTHGAGQTTQSITVPTLSSAVNVSAAVSGTSIITITDLQGVANPVPGAAPATAVTETAQYTGTVAWEHRPWISPGSGAWTSFTGNTFAYWTEYRATFTITPKPGWTLNGMNANSFMVNSLATTHPQNVTEKPYRVFPNTPEQPATDYVIQGLTVPVQGQNAVESLPGSSQYDVTSVSWMNITTGATHTGAFSATSVYQATVIVSPKTGYTLVGMPRAFEVPGVSGPVNNVQIPGTPITRSLTATFPATDSSPIDIFAIGGVTPPVNGQTPVSSITRAPVAGDPLQYTGTVAWEPALPPGTTTFDYWTEYTAVIMLTLGPQFTLATVDWNDKAFTVPGASKVEHVPGSNVIRATFPITAKQAVSQSAIGGVTAPVAGQAPVVAITETDQFTGTVTWSPALPPGTTTFDHHTVYTATITLTPKERYTIANVPANYFTVAGASTVTNPAPGSAATAVVTAVFPITGPRVVSVFAVPGVTPPEGDAEPVFSFTSTQYNGTVSWTPTVLPGGTFSWSENYTASIVLTANTGFTFTGVSANVFTVAGATSVTNPAPSTAATAVVTAVFPRTDYYNYQVNTTSSPITRTGHESVFIGLPSSETLQSPVLLLVNADKTTEPFPTAFYEAINVTSGTHGGVILIARTWLEQIFTTATGQQYGSYTFGFQVPLEYGTAAFDLDVVFRRPPQPGPGPGPGGGGGGGGGGAAAPRQFPLIQETSAWRGLGSATWKIDAPRSDFWRLTLDGEVIAWENFSVREGSTIITLRESYLRTLSPGTYAFRAEFINGYTDLLLYVTGGSPRTSDESAMGGWWFAMQMALLVLACLALSHMAASRSKRRHMLRRM
ncbi:MAG: leucine-rich repeat domain-containing protein [Clostridiales bacterium]|nr:leucine-rich repeat domain-containing protein [Clostridiales bacterium]